MAWISIWNLCPRLDGYGYVREPQSYDCSPRKGSAIDLCEVYFNSIFETIELFYYCSLGFLTGHTFLGILCLRGDVCFVVVDRRLLCALLFMMLLDRHLEGRVPSVLVSSEDVDTPVADIQISQESHLLAHQYVPS